MAKAKPAPPATRRLALNHPGIVDGRFTEEALADYERAWRVADSKNVSNLICGLIEEVRDLKNNASWHEGELIMLAMKQGYTVTHNPPSAMMSDDWNARHAWLVSRSQAFPAPYGCYIMVDGKREYKDRWNARTPSEAIAAAMKDMYATQVQYAEEAANA